MNVKDYHKGHYGCGMGSGSSLFAKDGSDYGHGAYLGGGGGREEGDGTGKGHGAGFGFSRGSMNGQGTGEGTCWFNESLDELFPGDEIRGYGRGVHPVDRNAKVPEYYRDLGEVPT